MTWKETERLRRRLERVHRRPVFLALMEQLNDVLKEVNPGVLDVLPEKINTIVSNKSVKKELYNIYRETGRLFYKRNKKDLIDDLEDIIWDSYFESLLQGEVGSKITWITDYSKELLQNTARDVLKAGQEEGLGIMEMERMMREQLTDDFTRFARFRSLRIVQTEVMTASNYATYKSGVDSGLNMMKEWVTAPVGVAKTERHNDVPGLNGQRRRQDEPFNVGGVSMMYPGDGPADQVINCRCSLSWIPIEEL